MILLFQGAHTEADYRNPHVTQINRAPAQTNSRAGHGGGS